MTDKKITLTDKAHMALEELIMFGKLNPEDMYSEKQLAEMIDMGRTPVREALQRLSYESMVTIRPRRGVQVPPVTVENQLKILEVRREVEALCVRLATRRATTAQKQRMLQLAEKLQEHARTHDNENFARTLKDIHNILIEASRNEYLTQVMLPLQGLTRRFWYQHLDNVGDLNTQHPATLHADIMQAVAHADVDTAVTASSRLIDYLTDYTYATISLG